MAELIERGIGRLSSIASVNLNAAGGTEVVLYTPAVDKTAIITHVIMRSFDADASSSQVTFGITGGTCDEFSGAGSGDSGPLCTLTNVDAGYATKYVVFYLDIDSNANGSNITPNSGYMVRGASSEAFGVEITTGDAANCTIDTFGYIF